GQMAVDYTPLEGRSLVIVTVVTMMSVVRRGVVIRRPLHIHAYAIGGSRIVVVVIFVRIRRVSLVAVARIRVTRVIRRRVRRIGVIALIDRRAVVPGAVISRRVLAIVVPAGTICSVLVSHRHIAIAVTMLRLGDLTPAEEWNNGSQRKRQQS